MCACEQVCACESERERERGREGERKRRKKEGGGGGGGKRESLTSISVVSELCLLSTANVFMASKMGR